MSAYSFDLLVAFCLGAFIGAAGLGIWIAWAYCKDFDQQQRGQ
jgi:hypothetical protein